VLKKMRSVCEYLLQICAMIIQMMVGNRLMDLKQFPDKNLLIEGYLEGLKNDMIEQNEDIMDLSEEQPEFRLVPFPNPKPYKN
jgi:hypothetical protein